MGQAFGERLAGKDGAHAIAGARGAWTSSVDAASEEGSLPSGMGCALLRNGLGEAAAGGEAPLAPRDLCCASPRLQETSPAARGVLQRVGGG